MITQAQLQALYKLYPQVVSTFDDEAFDADGNQVTYDINAINAKVTSDEQAAAAHKESAVAKLTAIGLTEDEVKALIG